MANGVGALKIRDLENFFVPILQTCKNIGELKKIHAHIVRYTLSQSNFLVTKMVEVCDKSGNLGYASLLFKQVKEPNGYLFNAMIRAHTHNEVYAPAISFYKEMLSLKDSQREHPIFPDRFTFPFVIRSCSGLVCYNLGKQVHAHSCKFGPESNITIENALIDMYTKCDNLLDAQTVFDGMLKRDSISWNSIISGHARLGQMRKARGLFDLIPYKNIVSWTAMISGYTRIGSYADALDVFRQMQIAGIEPDEISVISVLPACAHLGALEVGKWIHMYTDRKGLLIKTSICNALIEMYAKCGCIDQASQLFDQMRRKDVISWSAMIGGLACHGNAHKAIKLFERMKQTKMEPNGITFLGLLSACAHAGYWNEGLAYFHSMSQDHNIKPEIEHYGCLVDILGRAGQLSQALEVIEKMPMKPDSKIWGSLLGSCRTHSNLDIATTALEHLEELEPDDPGNYVLLSNIYADLGKWGGVSRMRKLIRSKSTKRTPGSSLIDTNNVVQEFIAGDYSKPFSKDLFLLLEWLTLHQGTVDNCIIQIMSEDGSE